jgi:hypothetical protein
MIIVAIISISFFIIINLCRLVVVVILILLLLLIIIIMMSILIPSSPQDLRYLVQQYDRVFFGGRLLREARERGTPVQCLLSTRMTSNAVRLIA